MLQTTPTYQFLCLGTKYCHKMVILCVLIIAGSSGNWLHAQRTDREPIAYNGNNRLAEDSAKFFFDKALENFNNNSPEALRLSRLALEIYNKLDLKKEVGRCQNIIGAIHFNLGEYNKAEVFYNHSYHTALKFLDTLYLSKSLNNLGNVYQKLGKMDDAINSYNQSLMYCRQMNDLVGEMDVLNNLAILYQLVGNIEKAITYYIKTLQFASSVGDEYFKGTLYYNLATAYLEQNEYSKAMKNCQMAYNLQYNLQYTYGLVATYTLYGNIHAAQNKNHAADTCFNLALELSEKFGYLEDQAIVLMHLGHANLESNKLTAAHAHFSEGLGIASQTNSPELCLEFHEYLYKIDSLQGDFNSAFRHLQNYHTLNNSLYSTTGRNMLEELEQKFELSRQENISQAKKLKNSRKISLLIFACLLISIFTFVIIIQQIRLKARKKTALLSQENLRSQINPHFIFNVLNSIHAYIQNNDIENSCVYLLKFSRLLRLTLDNSRTELTSIGSELEALRLYLELEVLRLNNRFEYSIHIDEEIDPIMFKIPPLILQPYVENSILHGIKNMEGKGKIDIQLRYKDEQIICSISDNGIGRRKSMKSAGKSNRISHGTNITETRLKLLNSFYGKEMKINYSDLGNSNTKQQGTKVEFNLPILT